MFTEWFSGDWRLTIGDFDAPVRLTCDDEALFTGRFTGIGSGVEAILTLVDVCGGSVLPGTDLPATGECWYPILAAPGKVLPGTVLPGTVFPGTDFPGTDFPATGA